MKITQRRDKKKYAPYIPLCNLIQIIDNVIERHEAALARRLDGQKRLNDINNLNSCCPSPKKIKFGGVDKIDGNISVLKENIPSPKNAINENEVAGLEYHISSSDDMLCEKQAHKVNEIQKLGMDLEVPRVENTGETQEVAQLNTVIDETEVEIKSLIEHILSGVDDSPPMAPAY